MGKGTKVVSLEGMGTSTGIFFTNVGMGMGTVVPYPLAVVIWQQPILAPAAL